VRDLEEAVQEYEALLGVEAERGEHEDLGADTAIVKCGQLDIILAYPTTPSSPLVGQIQQRGDGPFQATLTAWDKAITSEWDPADTGGVRFVIERE
jgi:hypothetical protein